MEEQEAYRILKLEYGAEPHKVKSAYRKMALKLHPDRNGSNTEFGKITNAYNVLKSIPAKPVKKLSSCSPLVSQRTTRPQNPPVVMAFWSVVLCDLVALCGLDDCFLTGFAGMDLSTLYAFVIFPNSVLLPLRSG